MLSLTVNERVYAISLAELGKYWTRGHTVNGDSPAARVCGIRLDRWSGPLFSGQASDCLMRDAFHYKPKVETFPEALARELRVTAAIADDPFKHLPPGLGFATLGRIVSKQESSGVFGGHWLNRHSPEAARHRAHWTPADGEESYPRPYTVQDGQRRRRAS